MTIDFGIGSPKVSRFGKIDGVLARLTELERNALTNQYAFSLLTVERTGFDDKKFKVLCKNGNFRKWELLKKGEENKIFYTFEKAYLDGMQ